MWPLPSAPRPTSCSHRNRAHCPAQPSYSPTKRMSEPLYKLSSAGTLENLRKITLFYQFEPQQAVVTFIKEKK